MVADLFAGQPANHAEAVVCRTVRRVLPLTPRMRASEWLERHFVIPEGLSHTPGPVSLALAPQCILPLELFCESVVNQVTVAFAAQLSKTQIVCLGGAAFVCHHLREPLGYMMPTGLKMAQNAEDKIIPTLRAVAGCPVSIVEAKLAGVRFSSGNSLTHYGGNAETGVKGDSKPKFIVDERDDEAMRERNIAFARARSQSFDADSVCMLHSSTYGDWGHGIHKEVQTSQVYRYLVPCPHCGTYQELHFKGPNESGVVWDKPAKGESWMSERAMALAERTAWYRCGNLACVQSEAGGRIVDAHKPWMMAMGVWVAQDPYQSGTDVERVEVEDPARVLATRELPKSELNRVMLARRTYDQLRDPEEAANQFGVHVAGGQGLPSRVAFEMGSVYSLFMGFGRVAAEFLRVGAKATREFATHTLGHPHREPGDRLEPRMVAKLCTPLEEGGYPIGHAPPWAVLLSMGADLQRDRAVVTLRAHGPRGVRSALVWVGEIPCAPGMGLVELDPLRTLAVPIWGRPTDRPMPIASAVVDSGDGGRTPEVYLWARRWSVLRDRTGVGPRARACKGDARSDRPHDLTTIDPRELNKRQKKHAALLRKLGRFTVLRVNRDHYTAEIYRRVRAALATGDDDGTLAAPVAEAWVYPAEWSEAGGGSGGSGGGESCPIAALCPGAVRMGAGRHFKELTAVEGRTVVDKKTGQQKFGFVVISGRDDHSLDAERYGLADVERRGIAAIDVRPDLEQAAAAMPAARAAAQPRRRGPSGRGGFRV